MSIAIALSCYSPQESNNGRVGAANILEMFVLKETATGQNKGLCISFKVIVTFELNFSRSNAELFSSKQKGPFIKKTRRS